MRQHYLLTIVVPHHHGAIHSYLITDDATDIVKIGDLMADKLTELGVKRFLPFVLATTLQDDGVSVLRKTVSNMSDEAARNLKVATNFHLSMFILAGSENEQLMELH
jgi:hypothetical protein